MPLGLEGSLPVARQTELLTALRQRLLGFAIAPAFVPPDRPAASGLLLRVRMARISGQATG